LTQPLETPRRKAHEKAMTDKPSDKKPTSKAVIGVAAIGSAAIAAALLYAGRKLGAKKKPDASNQTGTIPSGEPPQTD
jgi:hypothetical protein